MVAAEPITLAESFGQQLVERCCQLGQVPTQPIVAQERVDHRLKLGTLLRRHGPQKRLHRSHSLGQLLDDVVQVLGAGEEAAVLLEELGGIGVASGKALLKQPVQVADHLAVGRQVLGGDALDRVGQPVDVLVEHLAMQPRHQVIESVACLGLQEVVHVLPERHPGQLQGRDDQPLLHHRGPAAEDALAGADDCDRLVSQRRAELRALGGRLVPCRRGGRRVGGRPAVPGRSVEPPLDSRPLGGLDVVQLAANVGQNITQLVAIEQLLAALAQAFDQILEAAEILSRGVARLPAAVHQPAQGSGKVAFRHEIVGQGVHDLVGFEVGQALAAVPLPEAGGAGKCALTGGTLTGGLF